jgi:hypothetical protein
VWCSITSGIAEQILEKVDPEFLNAAKITQNLTPGRNNGFFNMLTITKAQALRYYTLIILIAHRTQSIIFEEVADTNEWTVTHLSSVHKRLPSFTSLRSTWHLYSKALQQFREKKENVDRFLMDFKREFAGLASGLVLVKSRYVDLTCTKRGGFVLLVPIKLHLSQRTIKYPYQSI